MPVPEHERLPGLHAARDGGQSLRRRRDPARISDTHKSSYILHVDYPHSEFSNVTPLKPPLVSRDWQEHHQGRNYGWIIGGILGLVIVSLAGAYVVVRWRRMHARKTSMTSQSELTPGKGIHASVESAPLIITAAELWVPTLPRISEHIDEPSGLSTLRQGSTIGSLKPSRSAILPEDNMRLDMYPLQHRPSAQDPSRFSERFSYSPNGLAAHGHDLYEDPHQEQPSSPPHRLQAHPEDGLEIPNVSASDSDSMQVNIPWRNSTRYLPSRTQSEGASQEPSSPLTPRNARYSYSQSQPSPSSYTSVNPRPSFTQPQPLPSSPLSRRADAEEERERPQSSSSRPPTTMSSSKGRLSFEENVSMNESEGSETTSTLSSFARLKLRLTGSAPFLPLIQESSPLDTDSLWRRFRGESRPISLKSQSSRGIPWSNGSPSSSNTHHSRSHSPSHSTSRFSHPIVAPPSQPTSPRPVSPRSASPQSASLQPIYPNPASPKSVSPPISPSPFPNPDHDRPVSPKSSSPMAPPNITSDAASPIMNIVPDVPAASSLISHPSPWQSRSSAVTTSYDANTSTSSLPLRDLSDFPVPPVTRPLPRPLPRRPLPYIPPPPSYLPPKPPVRIPDQERDIESSVTKAHSPR